MNIDLGEFTVKLEIIYKNNRNIYFRFKGSDVLVVTCPRKTSTEEILSLIEKNKTSLINMYVKTKEKEKYNEEFWYLGNKYNVVYDEDLTEIQFTDEYVYAPDKETLDNFITSEIDRVFNEEINICKKCFNKLPEFTLKTRYMKSRWGVCNRRNKTITLNTELIKKGIDLLDYVIIHEMAHFYEGNHSKKFWKVVSDACPNYKERRKALRK